MHTSGITVDTAVLSEIHTLATSIVATYIRIEIQEENFVVTQRGNSTVPTVTIDDVLKQISNEINDMKSPCYIIAKIPHDITLRNSSMHTTTSGSSGGDKKSNFSYQLLFFMPEKATIKDRMLYASSTQALKNGISNSIALHSIVWNVSDVHDINQQEYNNLLQSQYTVTSSKHDDSVYTREELQQLGTRNLDLSEARTQAIANIPIEIDTDAMTALKEWQSSASTDSHEEYNTLIFSLSAEKEVLLLETQLQISKLDDVAKQLSNEPRYILYRVPSPSSSSKNVFIYYCPDNIKPKSKMKYSVSKSSVIKVCESLNIHIHKNIEVSNPNEITERNISPDELADQHSASNGNGNAASATSFNKPKPRNGRKLH